MQNLEMRRTRDNIIAILNHSGLPAEAKRLIALEVFDLATKTAEEAVKFEFSQEQKESEEQNDGLERSELSD